MKKIEKKIKAIIHDWDDVVTNSFEVYSRFYFDLGEHFDLKAPALEGLKKHWGETLPQIAHGQWPELDGEEVEKMVQEFLDHQSLELYSVEVFPGVVDAFKTLSEGFKLAILSSGSKPRIEKVYREMIHPDMIYHKIIMAPPELKVYKPDPKAFDSIINHFKKDGISEGEVVYVGDSLTDLYAARNRGLEFYAVTTGVTDKKSFQSEGLEDKYIVNSFIDMSSLLC